MAQAAVRPQTRAHDPRGFSFSLAVAFAGPRVLALALAPLGAAPPLSISLPLAVTLSPAIAILLGQVGVSCFPGGCLRFDSLAVSRVPVPTAALVAAVLGPRPLGGPAAFGIGAGPGVRAHRCLGTMRSV